MHKTVVHVVSTADRCGPINVLREIVENLESKRYCAIIVTLSPEAGDSCIEELRSLNIHVEQLNLSRVNSIAFGRTRIARIAREVNARVVHTHGIRATVLATQAKARCPIVSTLHCDLIGDYRLAYGRVAGPLMARIEYSVLRRYDGVAAVSTSVAHSARKAGIETRVIPNGINLSLYFPPRGAEEVRSLRRKLGWPADAIVALHTGALIERKNPASVINGFRASKLGNLALLVFAGDGPLRAACEKQAAGAANIVFLGKRMDIPDLLKAADILLSNASNEGLPMALLEGCATGIQIVASPIAAHESIRRMFPEQVTLVNGVTPEAIAEALDKLVTAKIQRVFYPPAQSLGRVSGRAMSIQYQDFYDEIIAGQCDRVAARGSVAHVQ